MEVEQYIATFQNVLDDETCDKFVKWFEELSNHNITMPSTADANGMRLNSRNDEVVSVPIGIPMDHFPKDELVIPLWSKVSTCLNEYADEHIIDGSLLSHTFKVHRVKPKGGYHTWHSEHSYVEPYRVLAWHLTIEAPESGGETEFLFQSLKVPPILGQLVIWPAAFTHKHRGNPPLKGQKTYITGWFELGYHNVNKK